MSCTSKNSKGEIQIIPTPDKSFQIMHTNYFDPLLEADTELKCVLLLIDACTRFTWLFP